MCVCVSLSLSLSLSFLSRHANMAAGDPLLLFHLYKTNKFQPLVVCVGLTGVDGVEGTGANSPSQSTLAGQSQVPYLGLAYPVPQTYGILICWTVPLFKQIQNKLQNFLLANSPSLWHRKSSLMDRFERTAVEAAEHQLAKESNNNDDGSNHRAIL